MLSKTVVLVLMVYGGQGGTTSINTSLTFGSMEKCERAAAKIVAAKTPGYTPTAVCIEAN